MSDAFQSISRSRNLIRAVSAVAVGLVIASGIGIWMLRQGAIADTIADNHRLGVVLANLINIFNPQVIAIGGGVIGAGELLLAPARAVVAERVLPFLTDSMEIVATRFGVEAGMVGAAALAYDELARLTPAGGLSGSRR